MTKRQTSASNGNSNGHSHTNEKKPKLNGDSISAISVNRTASAPASASGTNYKHTKLPNIDTRAEISPSILSCIGKTPLVQLNSVPKTYSVKAQLLAKCEFFNAGGSVKDRIGLQMILDAEASGRIKPGDTLIEPTSGNTGIGLALAAATKGYRCIICLPEKMSKEKVDVLKALGAEIVRTPTEAAWDAPDSHISVAKRLQSEIPNSHILDQYSNPSNRAAHYYGTAEEIWKQCDGKVDMLVAGAGTGGTISGVAKRLKEYNPDLIVVGVDPQGSILAQPENLNDVKRLEPYQVEGIGYDFIPEALDRNLVDHWIKSNDTDSLVMMRRLIRDEGLLCGGSCGAAVSCAVEAVKKYKLNEDQRCVIILADSVRNYMTKALSDDWMLDHKFIDHDVIKPKKMEAWWADRRVCDIPLATPLTITSKVTIMDAIQLLKEEGFDMVPVIAADGNVAGVVTEGNMTSRILSGQVKSNETVEDAKVIYKTFRKIEMNDKLSSVAHALNHEPFVLVVTEQRCFNGQSPGKVETKTVISGIVTRIDLLDYISKNEGTLGTIDNMSKTPMK
jgi:cystathionine beta-synthase